MLDYISRLQNTENYRMTQQTGGMGTMGTRTGTETDLAVARGGL